MSRVPYHPSTFQALTFHDALPAFSERSDTPRAYLERCVQAIDAREPTVQAFAHLNVESARQAADESTARWAAGTPLSQIDGMPIGIKDLLETRDMPTQMGCQAYQGHFPKRDNAAVRALREAGAVVFGKTVTAELGNTEPGPTTNPFDASRTPGGSSSGSAAAVAAGMLPAAIGTQVGGSIIRPASFCGNVALKPTKGAINRGERQTTSMSTHGVHAGCIEDMWSVAIEIAMRAGGDPGMPPLSGPRSAPAASKPQRLIVIESQGWSRIDDVTRGAFVQLLDTLGGMGISVVSRSDDRAVEALEQAIAEAESLCSDITAWENHWSYRYLIEDDPERVSERMKRTVARAEAMTNVDYQARLAEREVAQLCYRQTRAVGDAVVMLSSPGVAPPWSGDAPGEPLAPRPTGDAVFNYPSSLLFAPAVTVPIMAIDGLPLGVQVMGQPHQDAWVTSIARWLADNVTPVVVD